MYVCVSVCVWLILTTHCFSDNNFPSQVHERSWFPCEHQLVLHHDSKSPSRTEICPDIQIQSGPFGVIFQLGQTSWYL